MAQLGPAAGGRLLSLRTGTKAGFGSSKVTGDAEL
jgi:hypothetical protein